VKLLRTIQLDPSDTYVFERAAEPGEWAVSGSFVFWNEDAATLQGKARAAFRGGFLGVQSLGWSTLVQIVEASEQDYSAAVGKLAAQLVASFGAPTFSDAKVAAEEEFAFASSLCTHPVDTLIAIHRTQESGKIHETFRSLRPKTRSKSPRAFTFHEVEGDDDDPGERIDLMALGENKTSDKP
jgi:hypothetical protein